MRLTIFLLIWIIFFLHTEIKALKDDAEIELLKARFKYSIVLIGMGVLRYLDDKNKEEDENFSTEEYVRTVANMVAPVILPIIEGMGGRWTKEVNINNWLR